MKLKYDTSTTEGKIAVMQHWLREPGGLLSGKGSRLTTGLHPTANPLWSWEERDYNYAAPTKLVPWTMDTVPMRCVWVRPKGCNNSSRGLITSFCSVGVGIGVVPRSYDELFTNYEHTLDGGKTWLPCGTEVEG